jgi:hypothetical protein
MRGHKLVAPSKRSSRWYPETQGWSHEGCEVLTRPEHFRPVSIRGGDEIHVLLPLAKPVWEAVIGKLAELKPGEQVSLHVTNWEEPGKEK